MSWSNGKRYFTHELPSQSRICLFSCLQREFVFNVKVSERPLCNVYINVNWADSKNRKSCFSLRYHVFHGWLPLTIIMGVIKFLSYMYSWCSVFKISVWQWKNDCRYQFWIRNRTGFYKNIESQTKKGRLTVDFAEQNHNQSGFRMMVWFILD